MAFRCYWILLLLVNVSVALMFVALNSGARVSQQSWLLLPKDKGGNSRCRDELSHGFQHIRKLQFLKHQLTNQQYWHLTVYLCMHLERPIVWRCFLHVFKMFTGWELDTLSNGRWTQLTKRANWGRRQVHMKKKPQPHEEYWWVLNWIKALNLKIQISCCWMTKLPGASGAPRPQERARRSPKRANPEDMQWWLGWQSMK